MLGRKNNRRDRTKGFRTPAEDLDAKVDDDLGSVSDVDQLTDLEVVADLEGGDDEPAAQATTDDSSTTTTTATDTHEPQMLDTQSTTEPMAERVPYTETEPTAETTGPRANVGGTVVIKGELIGEEDLNIDGTVEGTVTVNGYQVTMDEHGKVVGEITARTVIVFGSVIGNVMAEERIEVRDGGLVEGDLIAPKVVLAEGARFKGSIDMLTDPTEASGKSETTGLQGGKERGVSGDATSKTPNTATV